MTTGHYRRAYIDFDTIYVLTRAVRLLAQIRGTDDTTTDEIETSDLIHMLASLTLHAQTWLHQITEEILDDDNAPLTPREVERILNGARPEPSGWLND